MLTHRQKQNLISNWGDKAESMACNVELRVYDHLSSWQCYIYALNPEDEDEVMCLVKVSKQQAVSVERWFLTNIMSLFNEHGEGVVVDEEFRPRMVSEIYNKLREDEVYGCR